MATDAPSWHALLAPLPADVAPVRTAVLSGEAATHPEARAVAGWHHLRVDLSAPQGGLRNFLVVLDAFDNVLSASDGVLLVEPVAGSESPAMVEYVHETLGGRFTDKGELLGTHWRQVSRGVRGEDEVERLSSKSRQPTGEEVAKLAALVADVVRRAPPRSSVAAGG